MDYVVFDLEFSGMDILKNEILEIGAVRVDATVTIEQGTFNEKIRPEHIETAEPAALRVNGYTAEAWKDAQSELAVLTAFMEFARGSIAVGFNVAWDWAHLLAALNRHGIEWTFGDYHILDVMSIAAARDPKRPITDLHLNALCERYGIKRGHAHQALDDAKATLALWKKLREKTPS